MLRSQIKVYTCEKIMRWCVLQDYKPDEDPALFHSEKTGRGPLGPNWKV